MSKRFPSRGERFSALQSDVQEALGIVETAQEKVDTAIAERDAIGAEEGESKNIGSILDEHDAAELQRVADIVSGASAGAEELNDELQNWLDNMPENLQSSMKAEQLQEAIDELENFTGALESVDLGSVFDEELDDAQSTLQEAASSLQEAIDVDVMFPGMF